MTEEWTDADDVIEEIYEVRRQLSARFDNDPERIAEYYMSLETDQPGPKSVAPPRRHPGTSAA